MSSVDYALEAKSLSLSLGGQDVLTDVDFSIRAGEVVSIMGPSGSGKSTLLHVLAGILLPDSGRVWLGGEELTAMNDNQRSDVRLSRMGFVFQFGDLVPELSLLENVALPLMLLGRKGRDARHEASELLGELGLSKVQDRDVAQVSGGQAQRAAVARAIVHRPEILFADEPTGALDSRSSELVMETLVTAAESRGTAVVLVTHDSRTAAYAERNVVLRDGRRCV